MRLRPNSLAMCGRGSKATKPSKGFLCQSQFTNRLGRERWGWAELLAVTLAFDRLGGIGRAVADCIGVVFVVARCLVVSTLTSKKRLLRASGVCPYNRSSDSIILARRARPQEEPPSSLSHQGPAAPTHTHTPIREHPRVMVGTSPCTSTASPAGVI